MPACAMALRPLDFETLLLTEAEAYFFCRTESGCT